jgi:hypothetical protein
MSKRKKICNFWAIYAYTEKNKLKFSKIVNFYYAYIEHTQSNNMLVLS